MIQHVRWDAVHHQHLVMQQGHHHRNSCSFKRRGGGEREHQAEGWMNRMKICHLTFPFLYSSILLKFLFFPLLMLPFDHLDPLLIHLVRVAPLPFNTTLPLSCFISLISTSHHSTFHLRFLSSLLDLNRNSFCQSITVSRGHRMFCNSITDIGIKNHGHRYEDHHEKVIWTDWSQAWDYFRMCGSDRFDFIKWTKDHVTIHDAPCCLG